MREGNQTDIKIGGGVDIQDVNVDGRINGNFNQVVNLINDGLSTGTSLTYFIDGADNVLHTEQRGASNSITLDIQLSQSAFDIRQIDENSFCQCQSRRHPIRYCSNPFPVWSRQYRIY